MESPNEWPPEYLEFCRLFNAGEYYDAHEVLEDLWLIEVPPLKDFYKGLIQVAAAFHHWERGNAAGARKLYRMSWRYLSPYAPTCQGLALNALRAELDRLFHPVLHQEQLPPLRAERIPELLPQMNREH